MRTIHKFPVNIGANHILLTAAAKLLTVQEKDQGLNLWLSTIQMTLWLYDS